MFFTNDAIINNAASVEKASINGISLSDTWASRIKALMSFVKSAIVCSSKVNHAANLTDAEHVI